MPLENAEPSPTRTADFPAGGCRRKDRWASHHHRREVFVGAPTVIAIEANRLAPVPENRPDNLFQPVPGDFGARGAFGRQAHEVAATTWLAQHKRTTALAAAVVGMIAFVLNKRTS